MTIETKDEYMQVTPEGFISRKGVLPTGSWRLLGAPRLNHFGKRVAFQPFPHCVDITDWQYKNGKQRWHIMDLDHGTERMWTQYHRLLP